MHFCNLEKSRHSDIGAYVNFYEEINLRLEILLVNEDTVLTTIIIHGHMDWGPGEGGGLPTQLKLWTTHNQEIFRRGGIGNLQNTVKIAKKFQKTQRNFVKKVVCKGSIFVAGI